MATSFAGSREKGSLGISELDSVQSIPDGPCKGGTELLALQTELVPALMLLSFRGSPF